MKLQKDIKPTKKCRFDFLPPSPSWVKKRRNYFEEEEDEETVPII
jgi:hypothetical protein